MPIGANFITIPTGFMSSPCPALPTTSVANSSGTINDLIIRRKIDDNTCRSVAAKPLTPAGFCGNKYPTSTPTTIETTIHCVSEMRRNPRLGGGAPAIAPGVIMVGSDMGGGRLAPAQRRVAIAVGEIQRETQQEPPP